jgi:hypothetical protein
MERERELAQVLVLAEATVAREEAGPEDARVVMATRVVVVLVQAEVVVMGRRRATGPQEARARVSFSAIQYIVAL